MFLAMLKGEEEELTRKKYCLQNRAELLRCTLKVPFESAEKDVMVRRLCGLLQRVKDTA